MSDGEEVEEEQRENEAKAKEGEEIGMEHEISTPIQHKSDEIEITNSENVPIASASLDNDMNSETLLDTIKCELVSIVQRSNICRKPNLKFKVFVFVQFGWVGLSKPVGSSF